MDLGWTALVEIVRSWLIEMYPLLALLFMHIEELSLYCHFAVLGVGRWCRAGGAD